MENLRVIHLKWKIHDNINHDKIPNLNYSPNVIRNFMMQMKKDHKKVYSEGRSAKAEYRIGENYKIK